MFPAATNLEGIRGSEKAEKFLRLACLIRSLIGELVDINWGSVLEDGS